jgi:hypothetical protein
MESLRGSSNPITFKITYIEIFEVTLQSCEVNWSVKTKSIQLRISPCKHLSRK